MAGSAAGYGLVMGHYGGYLRNLKRATRVFFRYRVRPAGARKWRTSRQGIPVLGSPRRRRARRSVPAVFVSLALPALVVSLLGVLSVAGPGIPSSHSLTDEIWFLLFSSLTLIFLARSLSATAPWPVRLLAAAASLPYPICLLVHWLG